ncbi:putative signal transducing protein [Pleionea sediminis]|uniref:putative signal transducing protein n=1 Tax=Pleionea sediminis TaxID=2569479 RepID=UPI0011858EEB|nr:DUF2007 domain-containing protein [Pleionea sediminis]
MTFRRLCFSHNYLEANTIKSMLEFEGVEVHLSGEALTGAMGELPATVTQIEIKVKEEHFETAQSLLSDYHRTPSNPNSHWVCSSCGEENASSFEICWQCGAEPKG